MNIRVLVVDDEPLARVGITTRLRAYPDLLVVGECSNRRGGACENSPGLA